MKTTLAVIGLLAILGAIAAAVFFFGGFYNVAASEEDPAIVNWALVHIRRASIARHATDTPPLSLDDAAVVQEGARAFSERGCVNCHGAPGVNWAKFSEGLRPDPPDLKELVDQLRPQDLFWVVKHGIHMTGAGPGNLDDRRLSQEAAERIGGGLQGVVRETLRTSRAAAYF
jgi:mono/diheme cytochrome c family protein